MDAGDNLSPSCPTESLTGFWGETDGESAADSILMAVEVDAASGGSMFSVTLKFLLIHV